MIDIGFCGRLRKSFTQHCAFVTELSWCSKNILCDSVITLSACSERSGSSLVESCVESCDAFVTKKRLGGLNSNSNGLWAAPADDGVTVERRRCWDEFNVGFIDRRRRRLARRFWVCVN